jgi:hypothetical protein
MIQTNDNLVRVQLSDLFAHSSVPSASKEYQQSLCLKFNLLFCTSELDATPVVELSVSKKLQAAIKLHSRKTCKTNIYQTIGDGNCLFRCLSLAFTGTQNQHDVIRAKTVDHLITQHDTIERLYRTANHSQSYDSYVASVSQLGCWGTDREIVAAASLFDVSVYCFSQYGRKGHCLRHFSPTLQLVQFVQVHVHIIQFILSIVREDTITWQ